MFRRRLARGRRVGRHYDERGSLEYRRLPHSMGIRGLSKVSCHAADAEWRSKPNRIGLARSPTRLPRIRDRAFLLTDAIWNIQVHVSGPELQTANSETTSWRPFNTPGIEQRLIRVGGGSRDFEPVSREPDFVVGNG